MNLMSLNMKHDVTASVNVYLCFINNIKHYPSYILLYDVIDGCSNHRSLVLFICCCCFSVRSVPKLLIP